MISDPSEVNQLTPASQLQGEDAEETILLKKMLTDAENYVSSHPWCPQITERYFGMGVGGVVGVFLFRFANAIQGADPWLWVVTGDLPSAYLVIDAADNPHMALSIYCDLMDDWVRHVLNGGSLDDVFPVDAAPTKENANALKARIEFLRDRIIPMGFTRPGNS